MSERMTGILLPGLSGNAGLAEYGRKTVPEMVAILRQRAMQMRVDAEAILAAGDSEFYVDTYLGPLAQNNREILQHGRKGK